MPNFITNDPLVAALLHAPVYDIWLLPAFALLILATALNRGVAARILGTPALYGLGVISYSLYMTHWFVIAILTPIPAERGQLVTALKGLAALLRQKAESERATELERRAAALGR